MEQEYTKEGLPLVTENTLEVLSRDLITRGQRDLDKLKATGQAGDESYRLIKEWKREIGLENPVVRKYIDNSAKNCPEEFKVRYLANLAGLYQLLKSQAINNKVGNPIRNCKVSLLVRIFSKIKRTD